MQGVIIISPAGRADESKRADGYIPLHADVAAALRAWKPKFAQPSDRVFWTIPKLDTFKSDLGRAGIDVADDDGCTLDRHGIRTTFISWLGQRGVDPRAQITLARHKPQGVTLANYQALRVFDLWAEIAKLPPVTGPEAVEQAATGTD